MRKKYTEKFQTHYTNGDKIRRIRKRKGITIKALAESCGVSSKTIQHYESGERKVSDEMLTLIAEKLKVNPAALYEYPFESVSDIMHILFDLERCGFIALTERESDSEDKYAPFSLLTPNLTLGDALKDWFEQCYLLEKEQLSKDEYLSWQDSFPNSEQSIEPVASMSYVATDSSGHKTETSQEMASIYKRSTVLRLRSHADHALYGRNGSIVPQNILNQICNYTGCTLDYLNDESIIRFAPLQNSPATSDKNEDTLFEILSIMDKNADTEHFRVIQIQLSRIVIYNLMQMGFDRNAFSLVELVEDSVDYLVTGIKSKKNGTYFGFNFSQLDLLREHTGVSFKEMFSGIK